MSSDDNAMMTAVGLDKMRNDSKARLISAAPEMLRALEFCLDWLENREARAVCTSAIAKARVKK